MIERLLNNLRNRLNLVINRCIVNDAYEDQQWRELKVQVFKDETLDHVEHVEPYGMTSAPFKDAEGILLSPGGRRANSLAIIVGDRRYRLTGLKQGEVALYDDQAQKIHLTREGIVIETSKNTTVNAGGDVNVNADGNAVVTAAEIHLNGSDGQVVTTAHTCAFTGSPHPAGSSKCKAGV